MTTILDISIPLNEQTPSYTGAPAFAKKHVHTFETDGYNVHDMELNTHSGTHIDAPWHFLADGRKLSDFPIDRFVRRAIVVDARGLATIGAADVRGIEPRKGDAVLFRTENPACGIDTGCAAWLVAQGVSLVGIDHASIEIAVNDAFPVHDILLSNDVLILEFLRLTEAAPGVYTLIALPLAVTGTDGAPTRAILVRGVAGETEN